MSSFSRAFKTLALAALAVAVVAGCTPRNQSRPAATSATTEPAAPQTATRALLPGQPVKVALLLPLTGRAQAAGEALMNAAQLALFDVGGQSIQLIIKDTGDSNEGATSAMTQAVGEGAQLVLGPLFGSQIEAVTPIAQTAGVNVISFSNDETRADGNVFIMGISPRAQAQRIVSFAASRGLTQIAVIAPNTPFGQETLAGARATPGVSVVASVLYDTDTVVLSDEVKSLGGGFQAVLAPDGAKRMIGLAPMLAYHDIDPARVKFLGSSLWYDPLVGTEPNLIGAWFPAPPPGPWEQFKERYAQAYGAEPLQIAGLGYDAVALAATLVANAHQGRATEATATPGQWIGLDRNSITAPAGFVGVNGVFRFLADGKVERGLAILEVQRELFPVVEEAPAGFQVLTN